MTRTPDMRVVYFLTFAVIQHYHPGGRESHREGVTANFYLPVKRLQKNLCSLYIDTFRHSRYIEVKTAIILTSIMSVLAHSELSEGQIASYTWHGVLLQWM